MIDYHVHPDFSQDASGSIEDYCRRAVELGLDEMCFTTHYEPDPARRDMAFVRVRGQEAALDSDWPERYLGQIEACRRKFPGVVLRAGVEVGYEMGIEGIVSDFLERYRFDFVLGAVHCLDHVAITSGDELDEFKAAYGRSTAESVLERYFQYIRAAAGSGLFDCLAHLDIYRKYIDALYGPEFREHAGRLVEPALADIARAGVGIEVNSSALRRGDREPYPAAAIIRQAKNAGVMTFTVGSDAHRPEQLGAGLDKVTRLLSDLGITPARFESRRRT